MLIADELNTNKSDKTNRNISLVLFLLLFLISFGEKFWGTFKSQYAIKAVMKING